MPSLKRRTLLGGFTAVALAGLGGTFALGSQAAEKVIRVKARKFTYEPDVITLKLNEPVTLEFTSADVVMGFRAADFNIRTDIIPGKTSRVHFVPDKVGSFTFHCDIFCGDGHEDMDGTIKVVA
jgi:cytochrome c oxidase subunit 2